MEEFMNLIDLERLTTMAVAFLPKMLAAIVIFVGFILLYRLSRRPLRAIMRRAGMESALVDLLVDSLYRYAVLIVGLVMAADQLGINVTAALAGIGVAGIALGFAAQDAVANVISGIIIFVDKPFLVGDWIRTPDFFGSVSNITLRSTRIRTPRNSYVVVPNKTIVDAVLENMSKHGELRIDIPVGIAYKEDVRSARDVLIAAVKSVDQVQSDPSPDVVLDSLGDSSVNLSVRVWVKDASRRQPVYFDVLEACKLALDEADIQIPFPHLQLFVDRIEEPVWKRAEALRSASS